MLDMKTSAALGGVVLVAALGSAAFILSDAPGIDRGAGGTSEIRGNTPNPGNDMMKPVGRAEADRRAGVNRQAADEKAGAGKPYVAPTVIGESRGPQQGELPESTGEAKPAEPKPTEPPPAPPPQIVYRDRDVVHTVYRDAPVQPTASPEQVAAINEQIQALLKPSPGGFLVRSFAKGERPKPPEPRAAAAPAMTGPFGPGVRHATVARAGDVAYAVLDRGFNSDDPAAPIFATIVDLDERQQPGPLNGIRLMGQIVYSQTQASIRFTTMILQDGRQGPMQAIAITVDQARTGVAEDVDNHVLERYGGLVVAGLLQGVGQIGQQLTQLNTATTFADGYAVQSGRKIDWLTAGMGAALPVGQAMTSAAARSFGRPATLSSPVNFPIGIVFLQPVVVPLDAARAAADAGTGFGSDPAYSAGYRPETLPVSYARRP
ncbi:DotG/IcmE/VirB10 family protein [Methylobacterium sp. NEAU 140]|uniref:DotG/IcmE/VirB10 family protein n=1 Tax=Methylobacterium sp. NEAU 140 TaxID=3064945 RepID=UPI002733A883|nr:DotG/IcmE/VirB10 family protein [Methylobacterium sp. NEAU 140]MDP4025771.1 DotG/IcmE/VirB10 family protein [Methylobacterium sp. NEAU 140]